MVKYVKGQIYEELKNHLEGVQFDITDESTVLMVYFNAPTPEEQQQFTAGNKFEIRFIELKNIIMLTVKIGNLEWMDAPYSIHLSPYLSDFKIPEEKIGLSMVIMLIDCSTGKIENMRQVVLSDNFSRKLLKTIMQQKESEFSVASYDIELNNLYRKYSTNELVRMSSNYCRLNENNNVIERTDRETR